MLLLSLLALVSFVRALDTCEGDYWTAPGGLWGDPHITTFNQVYMHFQGEVNLYGLETDGSGRPKQILYYLMTSCDAEDTTSPPYRMIGSFVQYVNGPMSVMDYITLELFDDDGETYYVFLTPGRYVNENVKPVRRYYRKSDGATANLRDNNQNGIQAVATLALGDNSIGGKFTINLARDLDLDFDVVLTITDITDYTSQCTLRFNMRLGDTPSYQYRWNYIYVTPPDCYRCDVCGLFGDFRTPLYATKLLQCDGQTYKFYTQNWLPSPIEYEGPGWSFELNTYEADCVDTSEECTDTFLSDITPTSFQNGWGTENDGVNEWIGYTSMAMGNGVTYDKFLVIHPNAATGATAYRTYPLDGKYETLTAVVGSAGSTNDCDEHFAAYGSFSVEILVDGVQQYYRSGYGRTGYDEVEIDVSGAQQITIKTLPDGDYSCDHPAIAGPELICAGEEEFECEASLLAEIEAEAQIQRDALNICCRNLGGAFCTRLQEGAVDDICIAASSKKADATDCIEDLVREYFTAIVESECENQGKFGPVPRLLYDFQSGSLTGSEVMSNGNAQYDLQSVGDATIVNGILRCDGTDDYVYSVNNFDFSVDDHSLEVLVSIDDLTKAGGGAIAIDGNYNQADGSYSHDQFDSIVFNEYNGLKTWILGSDYWRRTKDATDTVIDSTTAETQTGIYLQMIAVYNARDNVAKLYRNGQLELSYEPKEGFMTPYSDPDGDEGTRIMFCQRHLNAGLSDFPGKIAYGAYYDYALSDEDVAILYNTGIVNINGVPYENVGDELRPDQLLTAGQALVSTSGRYAAAMQADGYLRIYDLVGGTSTCITTGTAVPGTSYLILQSSDGNVVQYDGVGGNTFNSGVLSLSDASPIFLLMQDDGNLVAYAVDSEGLIAYYDSNGYTSGGPIRAGSTSPSGTSGKSDYVGFDGFDNGDGDSFNNFKDFNRYNPNIGNGAEATTSSMSYLLYLVGFLVVTNIICLTVYCLRKRNNNNERRYKVVSVESDAEQVNLK